MMSYLTHEINGSGKRQVEFERPGSGIASDFRFAAAGALAPTWPDTSCAAPTSGPTISGADRERAILEQGTVGTTATSPHCLTGGDRSDHAAHDMTLGGHVARLASGVAAPLEAQPRESRSRIGERALAEQSAPPKPTAAYVTIFTR
jgi:hypothetical protein